MSQTITSGQIRPLLEKFYKHSEIRKTQIPLFIGNPGSGKTTIARQFAKDKGVGFHKLILSQRMPNEVFSTMMPDLSTDSLRILDTELVHKMKDGDILLVDEVFNGTLKQTLDTTLNVFEDREFPSGKKMPDILIIAASNPQGLIPLTPQIKERFVTYKLEFSESEFIKRMNTQYLMPEFIAKNIANLIKNEKFENIYEWNYFSERSVDKAINSIVRDIDTPYYEFLVPHLNEKMNIGFSEEITNYVKTALGKEETTYLELLKLHINGTQI